jgi:hypothetical protein
MAALKTLFRTVVMLAVLVILVKAWFHFELTVDKVQEFGARVVQMAQDAWNEYQDSRQANPALVGDPQLHLGPAPFDPPTIEPPPIHAPPLNAPLSGPVQFADGSSLAAPDLSSRAPTSIDTAPAAALVPMDAPAAIPASGDVAQMLDRLTHVGVVDLDLKPWGGSGRLFRFTCSAPWINSPSFTRHFEAVAETPEAAVTQVTAEIEAWQRGQQR